MGHVISFWNFGVCIVLNFGISIVKIKKNKIRTSSKLLSKKASKWRLKKPEGNNIIFTKKKLSSIYYNHTRREKVLYSCYTSEVL